MGGDGASELVEEPHSQAVSHSECVCVRVSMVFGQKMKFFEYVNAIRKSISRGAE